MKICKINPLYILLICAFALTTIGCKKWLREEDNDPSNLSPEDYYTLPGHADAAIAAAVAGPGYGLAIAALLIPALILGRWVYST